MLERFHIDHVAVLLTDTEGLYVSATYGKLTPILAAGDRVAPAGLAMKALSRGLSVVANDISTEPDYDPGCKETKSEMCVPLMFFGEKLGVMALDCARLNGFE